MSREEIIVTVIAAILSSSFLNGLITHFLYKNKLKKEQEMGHKNMIGEKVKEALLEAVNVNIKMLKKWKIKMYIFQLFFLGLCFQKGSLFPKTI